jgi:hypothetical protein
MEHQVKELKLNTLLKKKRKIRTCSDVGVCTFKNLWLNPDRCNAEFIVWHTCRHRGEERKF